MSNEFLKDITFVLDGTEVSKKLSAVEVLSYDYVNNTVTEEKLGEYTWTTFKDKEGKLLKAVKVDASGNVLEEKSYEGNVQEGPDGYRKETYCSEDGLVYDTKTFKYDDLVYEVRIEREAGSRKIIYKKELSDGVVTEIWCGKPGNSKNAEIRITEGEKVITGKRTYSKEDLKSVEEFSDGTSGYIQYDEEGKLLHRVGRKGVEQTNEYDDEGKLKYYRTVNIGVYDTVTRRMVSDSLHYIVTTKDGVTEESVRVMDYTPDHKLLREVIYKAA